MHSVLQMRSPGPRLTGALAGSILLHGLVLAVLWWQPPLAGQRLPTAIQIDLELPSTQPPVAKSTPAVSIPQPTPVKQKSPPPPVEIKPEPKPKPKPKPAKLKPVKPEPVALKPAEPTKTPPVAVEPVVQPSTNQALEQSTDTDSTAERPLVQSPPSTSAMPTTGAAAATSSDIGISNLQATYVAGLRLQIDHYKKYPTMARRSQQQGVVVLDFTLNTDGSLISCDIVRSSGFPLLDRAARRAVVSAAPFEPLPEGLEHQPLQCQLPLRFELKR